MLGLPMTLANRIMMGVGAIALASGGTILAASRHGTERQRYARRIGGMMGFTLGLLLILFAFVLSEPAHA
ncbi:hypothetical protein ABDK56_07570 [Sphingomonas sp. ASV193]|uniref:hypothetical protein n=1 Tax=Sphingomonas sp. ASV193 TaxID=3144405 RepID=UPI0032E92773